MNLIEYLHSLKALIVTRSDISILRWTDKISRGQEQATLRARVQFADGSFLEFSETIVQQQTITKLYYSYHYQHSERLAFRYDNAPHFPDLPNFPHHKHFGDKVEGCQPPDLADVLEEIDVILSRCEARSK